LKDAFKLALVFIGTIVGAGFATGQEILQFFLSYGHVSIFGIIIACTLFGMLTYLVTNKIYLTHTTTVYEYFGSGLFASIVEWMTTVFLIISYIVMISATGAIFSEHLDIPMWVGIVCSSSICLLTLFYGVKGLITANIIFTPIIMFGTVIVGVYVLTGMSIPVSVGLPAITNTFLFAAILYVGYNMLTFVSVATGLGNMLKSRRAVFLSSILTGIMLLIVALILWGVLYKNYELVRNSQIPMLIASGSLSFLYLPVLFCAIITTAISTGFGVINKLQYKVNTKVSAIVIVVLGLTLGFLEFATLVEKAYTFFGYIGIIITVYLIIDGIRHVRSRELRRRKLKN